MIPKIKYLCNKIKYNITVEFFNFLYAFHPKQKISPKIVSIDETINKIIKDKCSVSRFGDGEILLTNQNSIGFQKGNPLLSKQLIKVIQSNNNKHLVCISDVFGGLERYNRRARRFWRAHFYLFGSLWDKYLLKEKVYYNTFMTRPYMDFKSKAESMHWFKHLKEIWNDRNIVFIEGEKSRLGVGNDLFDNARSIKRILCPPTNAFDKYDQILNYALKLDKEVLILIALGPTATVLAYDLFLNGYQAVDIGHVDIEYEWCIMNASHKVAIPYKFVNEQPGGDNVAVVCEQDYFNQIICKIE